MYECMYVFSNEKKNLTCNDRCLPVGGGGAPEATCQWRRPGKILKYISEIYTLKPEVTFRLAVQAKLSWGRREYTAKKGG